MLPSSLAHTSILRCVCVAVTDLLPVASAASVTHALGTGPAGAFKAAALWIYFPVIHVCPSVSCDPLRPCTRIGECRCLPWKSMILKGLVSISCFLQSQKNPTLCSGSGWTLPSDPLCFSSLTQLPNFALRESELSPSALITLFHLQWWSSPLPSNKTQPASYHKTMSCNLTSH